MKRYTEWQVLTSEDVTVRMKTNVLSWFGHVERMRNERIKPSKFRDRGRPRLTLGNTVSKILIYMYKEVNDSGRRVRCM